MFADSPRFSITDSGIHQCSLRDKRMLEIVYDSRNNDDEYTIWFDLVMLNLYTDLNRDI